MSRALLPAFMILLLSNQRAIADESLSKAIALYNAGNYPAASRALYQVAGAQPGPTATYYLALTYEKLKYHRQAMDLFDRIVKLYPDTDEARLSADYIKKMDELAAEQEKAAAEAKMSPEEKFVRELKKPLSRAQWEALPNKVRFPITRERGHLMVTAKINGKYCKLAFDTGASMCGISLSDYPDVFSRAELDAAHSIPISRPHGMVMGKITEGEVSLNDLTRKVRFMCITEPRVSVIGQNFFKEYTYQVDDFYVRLTKAPYSGEENLAGYKANPEGATVTTAAAKIPVITNALVGSGSQSTGRKTYDRYTIPFEKYHDTMLIDIEINGYKTKATFDTGCAPDGIVCHPSMVDRAGLHHANPSGNRADRVVIGSIIKMDVPVYYANGLRYPLVGPKIFARPFTVDQAERVIRFDY
ncbi:MAG: hypothetical protein JST01_01555 [Cyanobacteria bacterium SZAS TMP-1]|nr:hypothetical protein [Cyanobacteria bacterium SZAS TMP-1]